jgi:hypothetical protein
MRVSGAVMTGFALANNYNSSDGFILDILKKKIKKMTILNK